MNDTFGMLPTFLQGAFMLRKMREQILITNLPCPQHKFKFLGYPVEASFGATNTTAQFGENFNFQYPINILMQYL